MVVRTLRLLRIFRVFKLARYLREASALREAFYISRHKIAVFMTTVLIVVLIASTIMHVVESGAGNEAFDSIPDDDGRVRRCGAGDDCWEDHDDDAGAGGLLADHCADGYSVGGDYGYASAGDDHACVPPLHGGGS